MESDEAAMQKNRGGVKPHGSFIPTAPIYFLLFETYFRLRSVFRELILLKKSRSLTVNPCEKWFQRHYS